MKAITIAGGITKDAVQRRTPGGEPVLGFSVAVTDRRDKDRSMYFDCALWGKRGDAIGKFLTKGTKVAVTGELGTREHDGKTYLTVNVNELTLMGGGQKPEERDSYGNEPARQTKANFSTDLDDDIPFAPEFR